MGEREITWREHQLLHVDGVRDPRCGPCREVIVHDSIDRELSTSVERPPSLAGVPEGS